MLIQLVQSQILINILSPTRTAFLKKFCLFIIIILPFPKGTVRVFKEDTADNSL